MKRAMIVAALVSMASVANARPLKLPLATYAAGAAADLQSTYWSIQTGRFRELNPIGRWLDHKPRAFVAYGIGLDSMAMWATHKVVGRNHPKLERVMLYSGAAIRFACATHNYRALVDSNGR